MMNHFKGATRRKRAASRPSRRRSWLCSSLLATLALAACDTPEPADAGSDAAPVEDLTFEAAPDPSERTDCPDAPPPAGEARAKHIVCESELIEGSLAMGRVGDVVLENANARFIVRTGEESASTIGAPAGGLIDAALHDGPDLLKEVFALFDFVSIRPLAIEVVDAGGSGEARVRVLFESAPIRIIEAVVPVLAGSAAVRGTIDYVLAPDADALTIEMRLTAPEGGPNAVPRVGVLAMVGGMDMFEPGVGVLDEDELGGPGPAVVGERESGAIAIVLGQDSSLISAQTIQLLQRDRQRVERGAITEVDVRVGLGTTAARALGAADESAELITLRGAPGDRVRVFDAGGAMQLSSRFDAGGEVRLAAGNYSVVSGFGAHFEGPSAQVPGDAEIAPAPRGTFSVEATVDGAADAPVRVTVERDGEELERFVATGATTHALPPGDYRITVSHGLEFDVFTLDLTLGDGASAELMPALARVLDTDGWVSVDLHLHSDLSTDSRHPIEDQVRLLAAEGVQSASSTDHDYITDYPAVAARAGVEGLVLVSGAEVSTTVFGHINGYPLRGDSARAGRGSPAWYDMTPSEVFGALRAQGDESQGGAIVQVNHPQFESAAFFRAVGLDRDTGRATADPTRLELPPSTDLDDFGFDVLEIFNGCCRSGDEESFLDYLALTESGRRFTMVGNSDTHEAQRPPGTPRSFVRVSDESAFAWGDIAAALRAGDVTVAAGAFVTAELMGPPVGDSVAVQIRVQAPPWIEVDRVRVFAGREVAIERQASGSGVVRFDEVVDVPLGGASFVLVRVEGDRAPEPLQRFGALAVTNPLFVE